MAKRKLGRSKHKWHAICEFRLTEQEAVDAHDPDTDTNLNAGNLVGAFVFCTECEQTYDKAMGTKCPRMPVVPIAPGGIQIDDPGAN